MTPTASRARFDVLRSRYVATEAKRSALDSAHRVKYGRDYSDAWLSRGDAARFESARAASDKAGLAFRAHLTAISPRDWSYGVPCHWVCERLTYEDAVRPANEPLSVVPPLSYGATKART